MSPPRLDVPAGYERRDIQTTTLIARSDVIEALAAAVRREELIHFASRAPGARPLQGRQAAYAISIAGGQRVVVRRNRHGGVFRKLTGSMFLWPTRAPRELAISLELRRMGIRTPAVVAVALYRRQLIAMSDVATEELTPSEDFGALLVATEPESDARQEAWAAVGNLLAHLAVARVRHHDLNVKNILLQRAGDELVACLLDVDRVEMDRPDADAGNRSRLERSLVKWRAERGVKVSGAEIERLRRTATSTG